MYGIFILVLAIILSSIRQVNQYERGIKFTLGKFTSVMEPGWRLVFPVIQSSQKIDIRVKAVDVPDQNAITKDNVSVRVRGWVVCGMADE
jgi:regulator of protease activity HflC (stomatin/prohibitin superfamily)